MDEALLAAVGIALSPFAVIPAVLLLFTARPRPTSAAFGAGWACGVAVVTTIAVLLADLLTLPDDPPWWATWTRIALGAALVAYGAVTLVRRSPDEAKEPSWLRTLESATPGSALRFGLVASSLNPKVALLAAAGGFAIGSDASAAGNELVAAIGFALIASATAVLPAVSHVVIGDRVLGPLGRVKDWLVAHTKPVLAVVLLAVGAAVLAEGLRAL